MGGLQKPPKDIKEVGTNSVPDSEVEELEETEQESTEE